MKAPANRSKSIKENDVRSCHGTAQHYFVMRQFLFTGSCGHWPGIQWRSQPDNLLQSPFLFNNLSFCLGNLLPVKMFEQPSIASFNIATHPPNVCRTFVDFPRHSWIHGGLPWFPGKCVQPWQVRYLGLTRTEITNSFEIQIDTAKLLGE